LLLLLVALVFAGVALDASRAPDRQLTTAMAVGSIHLYQRTASPILDRCGLRCRFTPSCSQYAEAALRKHGILAGSWRALRRVVRCGPWTPAGTIDPAE
jgi:hypothetical protein